MRKKIILHVVLIALFVFLPMFSCLQKEDARAAETEETSEGIRIYDTDRDEFYTVSTRDFLIGAIAAEMPLSFEKEALKAQGVAAYTFYSQMLSNEENGAVSASPESFYIYTDKEGMKERWGDSFETYYALLSEIASEISGQVILSEGELITASYYAISSGNTENSKDIWGGERTYLEAVASPWDAYAEGFYSQESFSLEEAGNILYSLVGAEVLKGVEAFGEVSRTPSGSVISVQFGDQTVSGGALREAFGLRSQNFSWEITETQVVFSVKGYGHGVGMSQTGANYLAKQGFTYEEILAYYYPGTYLGIYP